MKIAVIGGGYTGLSCAYFLSKRGFDVTVFERENELGGLATGFSESKWKWKLERHYHHLFKSDKMILKLSREFGVKINFYTPRTSIYSSNEISYFDSPFSLLKYSEISIISRIRTAAMLFYLKFVPDWKHLEKSSAEQFIKVFAGNESWNKIWKPLFVSKFGSDKKEIPTSWFWARIKKRGKHFGYPNGGFSNFYTKFLNKTRKQGVSFITGVEIKKVAKNSSGNFEIFVDKKKNIFDRVIFTTPFFHLSKSVPDLPISYIKKYSNLRYKGAINLILALKGNFLPKGVYWLNINDMSFPFLGVVEHTNFISKRHYGKDNLIYIGNYLPQEHRYFGMNEKELLKEYYPYLKKINPKLNKQMIRKLWIFKSPFAQPVMTKNYSRKLPGFETPINGLYLCNMQQVYPWDRQTNYALEFGEKVANMITEI
jgi:protoporphyrinogen oxidase